MTPDYICLNCPLAECQIRVECLADTRKYQTPPDCLLEFAYWHSVPMQQAALIGYQVLDPDDQRTGNWYKRAVTIQADRNKLLTSLVRAG